MPAKAFPTPDHIALDSLEYRVDSSRRCATITLNRPERLNAISPTMPEDIAKAVKAAEYDDRVHVVVIQGAGRAFCAGYDLVAFAQTKGASQGAHWDPVSDFYLMHDNTVNFNSLWRCLKPTIAKVRGFAVAGGSDIALCCDLICMEATAKIGYPPARVWGIPTTAHWVHRVGAANAKRMLFTGDLITGAEAVQMGLATLACAPEALDEQVDGLVRRIGSVPRNQLAMSKLLINQAVDLQGLPQSQMLATLFDGVARHSPEGRWFKARSEEVGFQRAVKERDSGEPIAPDAEKPWHRFSDSKARL